MIDGYKYLKHLNFGEVFRFRGRTKLYVYIRHLGAHMYEDIDTFYLKRNKREYHCSHSDASAYVEVLGKIWNDEFC